MTASSLNHESIFIMSSFTGGRKIYVEGSRPDIKVPMREIELSPTTGSFGQQVNEPVRVYDTSGPYTDPQHTANLKKGFLL